MHLSRIIVYPIKSLDGVLLESARITAGGILEHDRDYALFDAKGVVIDGKKTPRVHALRATYSADLKRVKLGDKGEEFSMEDTAGLEGWFAAFFGHSVTMRRDASHGFPDDTEAFGPTVVSVASLQAVATWYPGLTADSVRQRFRSNLEIDGVAPFWEDHLFGLKGDRRSFRIGGVEFLGHNPCQRCAIPTRDPQTGEVWKGFQKTFMHGREASLPDWAEEGQFNHYFRFAVNTSIPSSEAGKLLRVGDAIEIMNFE